MSELRVDHIGIAVRSLDSALDFYCNIFGVERPKCTRISHEKVRVAMISVGQSRLELIEPTDQHSTITKFIAKRGEGIHHIALQVSDLETVLKRITLKGGQVVSKQMQLGAEQYRYVFIHPRSTGGVLLELIQR